MESQIEQWLDEIDADDDSDEDVVNVSDHYSESEQSGEEDDSVENEMYIGRNGFQWCPQPVLQNKRRKQAAHNIVKHLPGVIGQAKAAKSPIEAFQLFISDEILEEIVKCTNIFISTIRSNYSRPRDAADTNIIELKACIGLLFLGGVLKTSHTNLEDLWANDGTGIELFRLTMGINRFRFLLKCMRFDDTVKLSINWQQFDF